MQNPHSKTALAKVRLLKQYFDEGKIPKLQQHEVHPDFAIGDRLNYLYFTLPVSINFQRSSPAMWQSALATFQDSETNYLFYPEQVVTFPRSKIQQDLLKHRLALQLNKHTDIWIRIASTLHKYFQDNPQVLLKSQDFDVNKIVPFLRVERKQDFPYLSGAKMANYWIYILHKFTDSQFKNLEAVSIIPDTHVLQASQVLGLSEANFTPEQVAEIWHELLAGSGITPIEMHPVLWNWSRNDFHPSV